MYGLKRGRRKSVVCFGGVGPKLGLDYIRLILE